VGRGETRAVVGRGHSGDGCRTRRRPPSSPSALGRPFERGSHTFAHSRAPPGSRGRGRPKPTPHLTRPAWEDPGRPVPAPECRSPPTSCRSLRRAPPAEPRNSAAPESTGRRQGRTAPAFGDVAPASGAHPVAKPPPRRSTMAA
jgi:hypothetical protein